MMVKRNWGGGGCGHMHSGSVVERKPAAIAIASLSFPVFSTSPRYSFELLCDGGQNK